MPDRSIAQEHLHAVYTRLIRHLVEAGVCEAWLAEYGPEAERGEHRQSAYEVNERAMRRTEQVRALETRDG